MTTQIELYKIILRVKKIFIILILAVIGCKSSISEGEKTVIKQPKNTVTAQKVAVDFINNYVAYCNNYSADYDLIKYILKQPNVTQNFKTELKSLVTEAKKNDPIVGLGFDPIFDAQDYPYKGFQLATTHPKNNLITVVGIDWSDFKLNIKMKQKNGAWLVDGVGVINILEKERIER